MDLSWDEYMKEWEERLSEESKKKKKKKKQRLGGDNQQWKRDVQIVGEVLQDADPQKRIGERKQEWRKN